MKSQMYVCPIVFHPADGKPYRFIKEGVQPLHYAALGGRVEMVKLLMEKYNISPDAPIVCCKEIPQLV